MNEDELRAFLESATVGGDDPEHPESAGASSDAASTPAAPEPDALELPPTEPIVVLPAQGAESRPSFDELLGGNAPVTGAPAAGITPIVLPTREQREPVAAVAAPRPAAPSPAVDPTMPHTAPLPAAQGGQTPTSQLFADLGIDAPAAASDEGYEKIAVTGGERRRPRFLPWIIVGAIAVIAIVASVLIVLSVRGGDSAEPPAAEAPTQAPEPSTPPATDEPETPEETPGDEEPEAPGDEAPTVEVGQTGDFPIPGWGMTGKISEKFGWPQYRFEGDNLILFGGSLLPKFPDSCADMREGFGLTKLEDGTLEVLRPATSCADATELYDQVWGLTAATLETFRKD